MGGGASHSLQLYYTSMVILESEPYREQGCDTLIGLHCKHLARLLPGYAAMKGSKQFAIANNLQTIYSYSIYLYLYEHSGIIYIFIWEDDRPTLSSCALGPWGSQTFGFPSRTDWSIKMLHSTANHSMTTTYKMLVV